MRLTQEQRDIVGQIIDRPKLALWADMGAGKTAIALHAVRYLLGAKMIERAVVVAPRAVADSTWPDECERWESLDGLRCVVLRGDQKKRRQLVSQPAEIYCIGRDALADRQARRGCIASDDLRALAKPKTMLIIDEASSIKNPKSRRFRALAYFPWDRVLELTGTPTPQDISDAWAQIFLLDRGRALGQTITAFRQRYMVQNFSRFGWTERPGSREDVLKAIRHLVIRLAAPPPCDIEFIDVPVTLPQAKLGEYRAFKREMATEIDGKTITAMTAGALVQKLLAWSSGGQYFLEGQRTTLRPHYLKRQALERLFKSMPGPFLCFYWFNFSIDDIKAAAIAARKRFVLFDAGKPEIVSSWNRGEIDVLAAHPQSAGMGLNLQHGGHKIVWVTLPWSSELWSQAIARLARRGQKQTVEIYRILARDTIDDRITAVLSGKVDAQKLILDEIGRN